MDDFYTFLMLSCMQSNFVASSVKNVYVEVKFSFMKFYYICPLICNRKVAIIYCNY